MCLSFRPVVFAGSKSRDGWQSRLARTWFERRLLFGTLPPPPPSYVFAQDTLNTLIPTAEACKTYGLFRLPARLSI